jgi:hypothetical protein
MKGEVYNMKRTVLAAVSVVALAGAFMLGSTITNNSQAQMPPMGGGGGKSCTLPKSYGSLKGAALGAYFFEDSGGVVRVVNQRCQVEATIERS